MTGWAEGNFSRHRKNNAELQKTMKGKLIGPVSLDISFNMIDERLNLDAEVLSGLLVLRMTHCQLKVVPGFLKGQQMSIEILDLAYNSIRCLDFEKIQLPRLRELSIQGNDIEEVSGDLGRFPDLVKLTLGDDLAGNPIRTLPNSLRELTKLEVLRISRNKLIEFPAGLKGLKCLRELYLDHNRIGEVPEDFSIWPELTIIDLSFNEIDMVTDDLKIGARLERFNLTGNKIKVVPEGLDSDIFDLALNDCFFSNVPCPRLLGRPACLTLGQMAKNALGGAMTCPASACAGCPLRYMFPFAKIVKPARFNGHRDVPTERGVCSKTCLLAPLIQITADPHVMIDPEDLLDTIF